MSRFFVFMYLLASWLLSGCDICPIGTPQCSMSQNESMQNGVFLKALDHKNVKIKAQNILIKSCWTETLWHYSRDCSLKKDNERQLLILVDSASVANFNKTWYAEVPKASVFHRGPIIGFYGNNIRNQGDTVYFYSQKTPYNRRTRTLEKKIVFEASLQTSDDQK
jgi:hypothetical protein